MTAPLLVVRDRAGGGRNLWAWCPGCDTVHLVTVPDPDGKVPDAGPVWTWDGNVDRPTIGPSILVTQETRDHTVITRCHSYLEEGAWRFLDDCSHHLAGQTVPMVPMPDGWP